MKARIRILFGIVLYISLAAAGAFSLAYGLHECFGPGIWKVLGGICCLVMAVGIYSAVDHERTLRSMRERGVDPSDISGL